MIEISNLQKQQLNSPEQIIVLTELAKSVAKPGCFFLEVGSWCGDSAIILGNIAKQNSGYLFCVDWWKGNVGTDLEEISSKFDIFSLFWSRILDANLEDVVIPIRGESDLVSKILKPNTFDLIFIDADHRYDNIKKNLQNYAPLIKKKEGIFCGHDCEGRILDYDVDFLNTGKNVDFFESVHCGVVLAVGEFFEDYSINYSIWSVQAAYDDNWIKTELPLSSIKNYRQLAPAPIGFSKNYCIYRYGKQVIGIPRTKTFYDIVNKIDQKQTDVIFSQNFQNVAKMLSEHVTYSKPPQLVKEYNSYNIISFLDTFIAVSLILGPMDITSLDQDEIQKYIETNKFIYNTSIKELIKIIDSVVLKSFGWLEEGYYGFNIVLFKKQYFGVSQSLGNTGLEIIGSNLFDNYQKKGDCIVKNTLEELKDYILKISMQKELNEIKSNRWYRVYKMIRNMVNKFGLIACWRK